MKVLAYYVSDRYHDGAIVMETPFGRRFIRVVQVPVGEFPQDVEWASDNAYPDETLLNTIYEPES